MAAPSYTTDLTSIIDQNTGNTANFALVTDGGGGQNSLTAADTDDFIEGANCASRNPFSSSTRGILYDNGATTIASGDAVFIWAKADVAQAIMWGDWKYDPNRKGQISNLSKTQYSYRNQCAIWGIQTYVKKRLKRKTVYLNNLVQDQEMDLTDLLVDERQNEPITQLLDQEKEDLKFQTINDIFDSKLLTQEQKDKVRLYYLEGYSLAKVGKKYGVTREAIRQTLKSCIKKLQGEFV